MQNPSDLNQALEVTKREAQKETELLKNKEANYKESEIEATQLKQEIKNLELQINERRQKVLELQGKLMPELKREIEKIKMDQRKNEAKISEIQREFSSATKR